MNDDLWGECFDSQMGMPPKTFEHTFCRVCINPKCVRSAGSGSSWTKRMSTQRERLFDPSLIADPNDPRFAHLQVVDFPSAVQEAMRLEISDRRNDWSVPTSADVRQLAEEMAGGLPPTTHPTPEPTPEPKVEAPVLQRHQIRGSKGDVYDVTCVSVDGKPQWKCTCKAFEFGAGAPCQHIKYASTLPPEDAPEASPSRFQAGPPKPATMPTGARAPVYPTAANIPMPTGGVMVDGSAPPPPAQRQASTQPADFDPWAPPPPKPKVVPVGGKVTFGGGKK